MGFDISASFESNCKQRCSFIICWAFIGFANIQAGSPTEKAKELYGLAWGAYAEIYITPLKNLEWYFEADVNGNTAPNGTPVKFAGFTGITWYLPAL